VLTRDYARWVLEPTLPERPTEPSASYLVCGTPRSGTWLLCGLLASTGVAGRPHEYFSTRTEEPARRAWGAATFTDYLRGALAAGTTANGVFGAKVMWSSMDGLVSRLRGITSRSGAGDLDLLDEVFPRLRFVWVRREDTVAQAVSWSKAIQTGHWHHWDPPSLGEPRFDADAIDLLARELAVHDEAWHAWFGRNRIDPLELRFEELVEDKDGVVRRLLAELSIDFPPNATVTEQTVKTGDSINEDWALRYRALKGI
jgi:trehalose 2-sulfotransferase